MLLHNNAKLSTEVKRMNTLGINSPDANGILEIIKQFFAAITAILEALGIIKKKDDGNNGGEGGEGKAEG